MKIGITADCHLKSDGSCPERLTAFQKILDTLIENQVKVLIVAGDLFDKDADNFGNFEKLLADKRYADLSIMATPGNHDVMARNDQFTSKNFQIFEEPTWVGKNILGCDFLFLPYVRNKNMSEVIEENIISSGQKGWVLISHGNFVTGSREINPYERGVYMPLFSADLARYQPELAFLGHIHKPGGSQRVIIPGSPCSMDITESGKRSFIILDSTTLDTQREFIANSTICLDEALTAIPSDSEESYILEEIEKMFRKWGIAEEEKKFVNLRLKVAGYAVNPRKLADGVERALACVKLVPDGKINFHELKVSQDSDRNFVFDQFMAAMDAGIEQQDIDPSLHEEIKLAGLNILYG